MPEPVASDLSQNHRALKRALGSSVDIIYREFTSGYGGGTKALLVFVDGLADGAAVGGLLADAVRFTNPPYQHPKVEPDPILDFARSVTLTIEHTTTQDLTKAVAGILAGEAALFFEGSSHALVADCRWNMQRGVEEPQSETEVRGPRDGMVENIRLNTSLIRRRIRDPKLRMEPFQVGKRTQTDIVVAYIEGVAAPELVKEVRHRISRIQTDAITESANLEEFFQDNPLSPFGSLTATERPDRVVNAMLEGRVAILVDNTPFVTLAPSDFWQSLQAPGDYYHHFYAGTVFRWIRGLALLTALTLPSLFVLLATFHHEMIPTPLALNIAGGREGTPLPTLGEVLLMELMFETIHEAGLRLPRAVGQTVSIVGALVIGEAAVMAGLVSPATVIVVATSGITGFAIPTYGLSIAIRLLRFPLLVVSGTLGVFGFLVCTSALALHMASLRSFGVPYLQPIAPLMALEQQDTFLRLPKWLTTMRPRLGRRPTRRTPPGQGPQPPGGEGS